MAKVDIKLCSVQGRGGGSGVVHVPDSAWVDTDTITSSGTSQQSDFTVPDGRTDLFWFILPKGGAVRALFGADPTASDAEAGGWLLGDGVPRSFAATAGDKVAIIDAA